MKEKNAKAIIETRERVKIIFKEPIIIVAAINSQGVKGVEKRLKMVLFHTFFNKAIEISCWARQTIFHKINPPIKKVISGKW